MASDNAGQPVEPGSSSLAAARENAALGGAKQAAMPETDAIPDTVATPERAKVPVSGAALRQMVAEERLAPAVLEGALRVLKLRPGPEEWRNFFRRILLLLGALLLASGVMFFFAANWKELHHFAKFALLLFLICGAAGFSLFKGLDSPAGRVLLLFATLLVGPLLAVYGQTYQTGAEPWELFRAWTLVLLLPALAGRQATLWLVAWLCGTAWGLLYLSFGHPDMLIYLLCSTAFWAAQFAVVALWEAAAQLLGKNQPWLRARWLPRLVFFIALCGLTLLLCRHIFESSYEYWDSGFAGREFWQAQSLMLPLYLVVLAATFFWYRLKSADLFMLGCAVLSACIVLVCFLLSVEFLFFEGFVGSILLWGLLIAGLTAGAGKLLQFWHRAIERERREKSDHSPEGEFSDAASAKLDWDALWQRVRAGGFLPDEEDPVPPELSGLPWYVLAIQGLGGWVASLLLLAFLSLFAVITLEVSSMEAFRGLLFILGILVLAGGAACSRRRGIVLHQFGLACALAGTAAMSVALALFSLESAWWPFLAALAVVGAYPVVNSAVFRCIAAIVAFGLLSLFLTLQLWGHSEWLFYALDTRSFDGNALMPAHWAFGVWWLIVCLGIALAWLRESRWPAPQGERLLPPALHAAYLTLAVALIALLTTPFFDTDELSFLFPLSHMLGIAAGCGLTLFAVFLSRSGSPLVRALSIGAGILSIACGYFVPGLSLALLGLVIGRHTGKKTYVGLSGAFLFLYLIYYYYTLHQTLLYKSFALMLTGAVVLGLAFALSRLFPRAVDGVSHG